MKPIVIRRLPNLRVGKPRLPFSSKRYHGKGNMLLTWRQRKRTRANLP